MDDGRTRLRVLIVDDEPLARSNLAVLLARVKERMGTASDARRFIIKNGSMLDVVKFAEVDWIEASDYYSTLHVGGRVHMLRRSLSNLELLLSGQGFCRVHRSTIVNLDRVHALEIREDGEYEIVLRCAQRLRMSRRYRKPILERLAAASMPERCDANGEI